MIALGLIVAVVLALGVTAFDFWRHPTFRRLAIRNALRRKHEALLVVAGSLFGTAIVTSAFVVGDTLHASIRDDARTRLGPIDDVALVHHMASLPEVLNKVTAKPLPGVDGVLPLVTAAATVATVPAGNDARRAEPRAFVHELDFDAGRAFGTRSRDTGLTDAGPTPQGSDAVIGVDLANQLRVHAGDQITVFVFGQEQRFRVRGIVPRLGLAGYHPTYTSEAEVVFVAPGTLAKLAAVVPPGAQEPEGRVLVSNDGGVFAGRAHSDATSLELQIRTAGIQGVEVVSEKKGTLDFADRQSRNFTELFGLIGGFTVVAGVLLLINVFVMLAEERTSELGTLRALGMKRNHLVRTFGLEGNLYALAASAAGAIAGIGVGRVVVGATERIVSNDRSGAALRFAVSPGSLATGFAIGLLISIGTVWATSIRIGRLNVIRAIRDAPEPPKASHPWRRLVLAAAGAVAGGQVFVTGAVDHTPVLVLAGGAVAMWSTVPLLEPFTTRRVAVTLPCATLLVFAIGAFSFLPAAFEDSGLEVFFVQGIVLVFTAVVLVVTNDDQFHWMTDRLSASGRGLAARLGLANPLAKRVRTALLLGMYALIVFVLVFMTVFAAVFHAQGPQVADEARAGYDLRVDSNEGNPVTAAQLTVRPDVAGAAPLVQGVANIATGTKSDSFTRQLTGFDESLLQRGIPALTSRDPRYPTDEAVWRGVLTSADLVIVPSDFLGAGNGPPTSTVKVGDQLTVIDPAGGRRHVLTVVAVAGDLDPAENGAMVAAQTLPTLVERLRLTRFYVAARPGTTPDQLAARLQGDLVVNGVKADTFRSLVDERLRGTEGFIRLLQGFLALGLLIGIAGLGVVMVRAVRERRREIGMLRAIGFAARTVRRAFLIEASFIAVQGIVIGTVLGLVTGFSVLSNSSTFGDRSLRFSVPWAPIAFLAGATLVASLLAVLAPATRASRIRPAAALRIAD